MTRKLPAALIDNPAWPLLNAQLATLGQVVDAAPATTDFDTDIVEATASHFDGALCMFLNGACAGQMHIVDTYTAANGNLAFAASDQWTDAPASGDHFVLLPSAGAYLKKIFASITSGSTRTAGSTTANWNAAEADIVTIGANDTNNKVHVLIVDLNALTAAATITIKLYTQVNGVERMIYEEDFVVGTDPDGVVVIDGTMGITEALRVTAQSDNALDDGLAIPYEYLVEAT